MTRDRVSLPLGDVRCLIGLVWICQVSGVDRAPHRVGEGGCVAVLDAVEHDLVALYKLVDVHAQVRRAWMPDELPCQPSAEIARPPTAGPTGELHADSHAHVPERTGLSTRRADNAVILRHSLLLWTSSCCRRRLRGAHPQRSSMRPSVKPRRDWPESELMRHTDVPCGSRRRPAASESRRHPRRDAVRCLPPERPGVDRVSRARAGRFLSPSPRSTPPRRAVPADPRRGRSSSARINRSSSADHIGMRRSPANNGRVIKLTRHARWHCALPNRGRHPTESPT